MKLNRPPPPPPALRKRAWPWSLSLALIVPGAHAALFLPGAAADPSTGDLAATAVAPASPPANEPLRAFGPQWTLAPWRKSGTVTLDGRWLRQEDGRTTRQGLVFTDIEWASYVWQPWFVQLRLGLGMLGGRDLSKGGGSESTTNTSSAVTGRMAISVFPASRFPFEFRADVGDSRTGGDSLGGDVRTQRLSLSQAYRPETGNDSLHLQLEHSRLRTLVGGSLGPGTDTLSSVQATAQRLRGPHSIDLGANFAVNERTDVGDQTRLSSLSARHGFHPSAELQVESMASWNEQRLRNGGLNSSDFGTDIRQLSTVVSWRPSKGEPLYDEERQLLVAGSARWVQARTLGNDSGQQAQSVNATLGATLDLSRAWRLSGSLSGNHISGSGDAQSVDSATVNATAGWTPVSTLLGEWRYSPTAAINAGLSEGGPGGGRQLIGLQGSHSVSRDWTVSEGQQLALNISQSAATLYESKTSPAPRSLAHSLGLFWQSSDDNASQRFAGLSFSDSRSWAASRGSFQLANLQITQRTQVSRMTAWSANITAQATRNKSTEIDVFTGELRTDGSGWQHFYSGGASLEQQRLLGVPRLRHTLTFGINSQQIERRAAGDIDAPRERISQSLESRVDYGIGRLDLRFSARWARVENRSVASIMARAQRRF